MKIQSKHDGYVKGVRLVYDGYGGSGGLGGGDGSGSAGYGGGGGGYGSGMGGLGGGGGGYGGYGSDSGADSAYGGGNTGPSAGAGIGFGLGGFGDGGYNGYGSDMGPDSAYGGFNTGPGVGLGMGGFGSGYGDAFGLDANTSLASMFATPTATDMDISLVDTMTPEERARKMALSIGVPMAMQAMGPVGGLLGPAVGAMTGTMTNNQAAKMGMSGIMSGLGTALGGPIGGLLGSLGARALGNPTGPGPTSKADGKGFDLGGLAGGLAGMYMASQGAKDQKNVANSAAAQQLRQQLDRRDAASGRRSQYGPREVELQAKLAQMQAQYAPGLMNASTSANNQAMLAQQARRQQQNAQLNNLLQLGQKSGAFDAAQRGLSGLFGNGSQGGFDRGYIDPTTFYA